MMMRAREKLDRRPGWNGRRRVGLTHGPPALLARTVRGCSLTALLVALALGAMPLARAQERTALIRVLESGHDFRARVRAALALGSTHDASALVPLSNALGSDDEAAVRAACAAALGALGLTSALPALRSARADTSSEVRAAVEDAIRALAARAGIGGGAAPAPAPPTTGSGSGSGRIDWGATRWLVVMGTMENRSSFTHDRLETLLAREVRGGLGVVGGVAVVDGATPHADADAEASRRSLPALRVEGSIAEIGRVHAGGQVRVSCDVSVLVLDEPGRSLRGEMTASATAAEEAASTAARAAQERRLAEQACEAAAERAMGGAARLLASAH